MKFFSKLGSCWSGAPVTPAADSTGLRPRTEDQGRYCHSHRRRTFKRPAKLSGAVAAHWKPKLNSISESSPMSDTPNGGRIRRTDGIDHKKRPVKPNPKPQTKGATLARLDEDYW